MLRSRAAVGEALLASGVPTAALGAAVIIGSGSLSFDLTPLAATLSTDSSSTALVSFTAIGL